MLPICKSETRFSPCIFLSVGKSMFKAKINFGIFLYIFVLTAHLQKSKAQQKTPTIYNIDDISTGHILAQIQCEDIFQEFYPAIFPEYLDDETKINFRYELVRRKNTFASISAQNQFYLIFEAYLSSKKTGQMVPFNSVSFVIQPLHNHSNFNSMRTSFRSKSNTDQEQEKGNNVGIYAYFLDPSPQIDEVINCSTPFNSILLIREPMTASRNDKVEIIVENLLRSFELKIQVQFKLFSGSSVSQVVQFPEKPESDPTSKEKTQGKGNLVKMTQENLDMQNKVRIKRDGENKVEPRAPTDDDADGNEMVELTTRSLQKTDKNTDKLTMQTMPEFFIPLSTLYGGCGQNYSCFSYPHNCHQSRDCLVHSTLNIMPVKGVNKLHVVLLASVDSWVAVGLSNDAQMGDDVVVVCKRIQSKSSLSIWMANNLPAVKERAAKIQKEHKEVTAISGSVINGVISCDFTLDLKFVSEANLKIDLKKEKYFLLLAIGQNNKEPQGPGSVTIHSFSISSKKGEFLGDSKHRIIPGMTHNLISIHIILATLVYGFFMPSGILISRYGQQAFGRKWGRFPVWLIWHGVFQTFSVLGNLVSMMVIYWNQMGFKNYVSVSFYHTVIGPMNFVASFLNFLFGVSMYIMWSGETPAPFAIRTLHGLFGHLTYFSGAIELIRGAYLRKSWVCCSFAVAAGLLFVFYIATNIFLMFNTDYLRRKQLVDASSVRTFFGPAIELKADADQKEYYVRRSTIIYLMISLFAFVLLMFIEVGLSENTCNFHHADYI